MNPPNGDGAQSVLIAAIYLIAGLYAFVTGISSIRCTNLRVPIFYELGILISKLVHGKNKTVQFNDELSDPKKALKYGVFMIVIGLIFVSGSLYLLFGKF